MSSGRPFDENILQYLALFQVLILLKVVKDNTIKDALYVLNNDRKESGHSLQTHIDEMKARKVRLRKADSVSASPHPSLSNSPGQ